MRKVKFTPTALNRIASIKSDHFTVFEPGLE